MAETSYGNNTRQATAATVSKQALNVLLVPITANGFTGSLTDSMFLDMIDFMRATYPTATINFLQRSGGPHVANYSYGWGGSGCGPGWSNKPANAYVVGVMHGGSDPGGICGCGHMSDKGVAVRLTGACPSGDTMSHEIGHNMGRSHAPCGTPDPAWYPTYTDESGVTLPSGSIGEVGVDVAATVCWPPPCATGACWNPSTTYDMMSYCTPWISPYTYDALMTSGIPSAKAAVAVSADVPHLVVRGLVVDSEVELPWACWVQDEPEGSYSGPGEGPYRVDLEDAAGSVLASRQFDPRDDDDFDPDASNGAFLEVMPLPEGVARVSFHKGGAEVGALAVSAHAPTVSIATPNGGESWDGAGPYQVTWEAADADGDTLEAAVLYSADGGTSWLPLAIDLTGSSTSIDASTVAGSTQALIRVRVSDGFNTAYDTTDEPFAVASKPPTVVVLAPRDGAILPDARPVPLSALVMDPEDGAVDDAGVSWTSDRDGLVANGAETQAEGLTCGVHRLTLAARDNDGQTGTATLTVTSLAGCGDRLVVVPAVARTAGLEGTSWVSDVVLHNPGAAPTQALLYLMPRSDSAAEAVSEVVEVATGESLRLADLVGTTFGLDGTSGGLLVVAGEQLLVSSRTFNDAAGGTFGQYIPAAGDADQLHLGEDGRLVQLAHSSDSSQGFRTNVGFVNASPMEIDVELELFRADGTSVSTRSVSLPPFAFHQENNVFAGLGNPRLDDAFALVRTTTEGASYLAYASVVDNRSGDPVYIPAQRTVGAGEPPPRR